MSAAPYTSALKLKPIKLGRIKQGGYVIGYEGAVSAGCTLWLGLPDPNNAMEVTGKHHDDLLDGSNLPAFLSLIGKQKTWWGAQGKCRLFVKRGPSVLAQSNEESFSCPVRPYVGRLHPLLGRGDAGPSLRYTGTPPKYPDGRFLSLPPIDGCYYFAHAGSFETDNAKRGFNCITYVGAVFGVDVNSGAMSADGTRLANHCGCMPVACENKSLLEVRAFFAKNRLGTYFMWSKHHIVIVVNGVVCEFREKFGRFNEQPIEQWQHNDGHWRVRKASKQF